MKQFVIVLLAAAAIVAGWMLYRGDSETQRRPQRPQVQRGTGQRPAVRPQTQLRGKTKKVPFQDGEVEVFVPESTLEQQREAQELKQRGMSWRERMGEADYVPLEDAWQIDLASVDYDQDVLISFVTESGRSVEITNNDLQRYVALSTAGPLMQTALFAAKARVIAEQYGEPYGMTDEEWDAYFAREAKERAIPVDQHRSNLALSYDIAPSGVEIVRRQAVESLLAYFPGVQDQAQLPALTRATSEVPKDQKIQMDMVTLIEKCRVDMLDEENIGGLVGVNYYVSLYMARARPIFELRSTWSFLDDENMPEDAFAACSLGEDDLEDLIAPWMRPGDVHYVTLEDVQEHLPALATTRREGYLRELCWLKAVRAELEAMGAGMQPEDRWMIHAKEEMAEMGIPLAFSRLTSVVQGFPSPYHYRAFMGTVWTFADAQPEDWLGEESLREHYARNRVFCEQWQPGVEVIAFPNFDPKDDFRIDWDKSYEKAEEARESILSGDVEFSTLRARQHKELAQAISDAGHEATAQLLNYVLGQGVMFERTLQLGRGFGETEFGKLVDGTSLTRNALARLDRGQPSPVWRTPRAHVVMRIINVTAAELEGEYEDFEDATRMDYVLYNFRAWTTEKLSGLEVRG